MNHMNVMIKISPISAIVIISNVLCRMVSQIFYISWDIEPHSKKNQNITVAKKIILVWNPHFTCFMSEMIT